MRRIGGGVMRQPGQRVIHPLRGKGRKRGRAVGIAGQGAVDDVIIGRQQVRHVEDIAQGKVQHAFLRHRDVRVARHGEMHRDRRGGRADFHRDAVVLDQKADLLDQVLAKEVGPRDRGGIGAGPRDMAKGQAGVDLAKAGHGDADFGVEGADAGGGAALGHGLVEMPGQMRGRLGIQPLQPGDGGFGVVKAFGAGAVGQEDGRGRLASRASVKLIRHISRNRGVGASDGFMTGLALTCIGSGTGRDSRRHENAFVPWPWLFRRRPCPPSAAAGLGGDRHHAVRGEGRGLARGGGGAAALARRSGACAGAGDAYPGLGRRRMRRAIRSCARCRRLRRRGRNGWGICRRRRFTATIRAVGWMRTRR